MIKVYVRTELIKIILDAHGPDTALAQSDKDVIVGALLQRDEYIHKLRVEIQRLGGNPDF
jgi:hypothetical protein